MSFPAALRAIERILLTLWVGGLWITGLVLAPVLFRSFERMLAGDIAGRQFSAVSLVGIGCGVLLLSLAVVRARGQALREWRVMAVALMLLVTLVGEFGLAARMRDLKELAAHHPSADLLWAEFRRLHAVAGALYVLNSALGLVLVVAGLRPRARQAGS